MNMDFLLWLLLVIVFFAGAVGGLVNALISENVFWGWKKEKVDNRTIWRPGIAGNMLISGIAACISWGLYGPFAASYIIGGTKSDPLQAIGLTLSALVGAVLVGVSGARWLTNEVDKNLLKQAASSAAATKASETKAAKIAIATPFQAMKIAMKK
jgi:hypothetical protein